MLALGIDVGAKNGVVLLDVSAPRPRYIDSCTVEDDLAGVLDVRFFGLHAIARVGIETPSQVFTHGRAKGDMGARIGIERALLVARGAAGEARAVAKLRAPGIPIHEAQAHEVRRAVLGKLPRRREDIDRLVARMVPTLIADWPTRSNDHVRDAAVAALYADRRERTLVALTGSKRGRAA